MLERRMNWTGARRLVAASVLALHWKHGVVLRAFITGHRSITLHSTIHHGLATNTCPQRSDPTSTMSEDQDLLARIGQLAGAGHRCLNPCCHPDRYSGHINLHRAQPSSSQPADRDQTSSSTFGPQITRGHASWRPPRQAPYGTRGRGASRRYPTSHSLVLNRESSRSPAAKPSNSLETSDGLGVLRPTSAYVSKRGRHNQLINASVLDKVTQQRKLAIEGSQQRKVLMDDQRERERMYQYMEGLDASKESSTGQIARTTSSRTHDIQVNGLTFQIQKNGSKLARVHG